MLNVVYLDSCLFPQNYQIRKLKFPHDWTVYHNTAPEEVFERCQDADIILTCKVILDRPMLQRLSKRGRLKLIQVTFTGMNNIDLEAAAELGITVQNVSGYSTNSVAEHVIAAIFNMARNFHGYGRDQLTARWTQQEVFTYQDRPVYDVNGKTLTIIGKGSIGNLVAQKCKALGLNIVYAERKDAKAIRPGYTEFESAIRQADFITLHCPLTASTTKLVDANFLKLMKRSAFLINTGRGGLIDEQALTQALVNGEISGADLDVLTIEPPSIDNPLVQAAIELPNLHLTPHIGFASVKSLKNLSEWMLERVEEFVEKTYPNYGK